MTRRLAILAMLSFLSFAPLRAEDISAVCTPVVAHLKNTSDLYSEEEQFSMYQDKLRHVSHESLQKFRESGKTLKVNVPLAEEIIGLSGSDTERESEFASKYDAFMRSTYATSSSRAIFHLRQSSVSTELGADWVECVRIMADLARARKGTFIAADGSDFRTFNVSVRSYRAMGNDTTINAITPASKVKCYYGLEPITKAYKVPSNEFDIQCDKNPWEEVPLSIETESGASPKVILPAQTPVVRALLDAMRTTLHEEVTALRNELATTKQALADAKTANDTHFASLDTIVKRDIISFNGANYGADGQRTATNGFLYSVNAANVVCPDGLFYVGRQVVDSQGGFYIICKPARIGDK